MRKKKISKDNPSSDSKWLLEVGVIGIDKTLKILKLHKISLLELEQILRQHNSVEVSYKEKAKLPWREIQTPDWEKKWERLSEEHRAPYKEYLDATTRIVGMYESKKVKQDGYILDEGDWPDSEKSSGLFLDYKKNGYIIYKGDWPGSEESSSLWADFRKDELSKKRKGRGPTSERKPLSKWILNADILKLFRAGILDNDTERKKLDRIKTHSMVLGNALDVIESKGRVKFRCPADCYPKKVKEMIGLSLSVIESRKEFQKKNTAVRIAEIEEWLRENNKMRCKYLSELEELKGFMEKSGADV